MAEIEKISIDLGNVQKTLFLPLWGRAVESQKEHPELVDQTAVEIMKKVDYDFSAIAAGMDDLSQIAWIRRSMFNGQSHPQIPADSPAGNGGQHRLRSGYHLRPC